MGGEDGALSKDVSDWLRLRRSAWLWSDDAEIALRNFGGIVVAEVRGEFVLAGDAKAMFVDGARVVSRRTKA